MSERKERSRIAGRPQARSIARLAREGASHDVWIHEALRKLQAATGADRCGVWLRAHSDEQPDTIAPAIFRGEVFEAADGYLSGEWTLLSLASHLPQELLSAGKTAEFHLAEDSNHPIVGPAMGMRLGLWVPVLANARLHGVMLIAARKGETPLPREAAEELAEELGLTLESEERSRLAEERKADLELSAHIRSQIAAEADGQLLLQALVQNCTSREGYGGAGAVFALIGERRDGLAVEVPSGASAEEHLEIRAHTGESAWAHSVKHGPLEMFWRRAIETGQMVAAEPTALPLARGIARIVAFPLSYEGAVHGVLLAGIPHGRAHAESLERLERRALLAGEVLQQQARGEDRARLARWRQALLAASDRPVLLLDARGTLREISRGAAEILGPSVPIFPIPKESPGSFFAELFRPRDWERASRWLQWDLASTEAAEEQRWWSKKNLPCLASREISDNCSRCC